MAPILPVILYEYNDTGELLYQEPISNCLAPARRSLTVRLLMTRILVMPETISLSSVKAHLSEVVDRVELEQERVVLTRNGKAAAVLISTDDLEGLEETLAILSDPTLREQIRAGERAAAAGDTATLEELQADLQARRANHRAA